MRNKCKKVMENYVVNFLNLILISLNKIAIKLKITSIASKMWQEIVKTTKNLNIKDNFHKLLRIKMNIGVTFCRMYLVEFRN